MEKVTALSKKVIRSYRSLPDKKQYIEFFTALLSVPVLITVIMLNINSLKLTNNSKTPVPTPQVKQEKIYIPVKTETPPANNTTSVSKEITPSQSEVSGPTNGPCKPGVGPISITSPQEGETITDNPVSLIIKYNRGEYCSVVWSYRVDSGNWSDYDDKSIALFNLNQGKIKIDVRVKSIVNNDEQILTRSFNYKGTAVSSVPVLSPQVSNDTASASKSAN